MSSTIAAEFPTSDQNPIMVRPDSNLALNQPLKENRRWRLKQKMVHCPQEDYADYDLARQLEAFQSLVRSVSDRVLVQPLPHDPKQVRWWNRSLTNERKLVIRLRRRYRTARRRGDEAEIRQRKNELQLALRTY